MWGPCSVVELTFAGLDVGAGPGDAGTRSFTCLVGGVGWWGCVYAVFAVLADLVSLTWVTWRSRSVRWMSWQAGRVLTWGPSLSAFLSSHAFGVVFVDVGRFAFVVGARSPVVGC